ncbi:MAG: tetratricopeptide repeat protein [Bacteroidales bacterium]|nr:tetratricopeptide repeat protein [Bacteroidales bacterium]MCD4773072.1 tetratricopeptide repeat protein [Bacteroidales bacterium]
MKAIFYFIIAILVLVSCSSGEDKKEKSGKEMILNKQISPESKSVNNQEKTIVPDSISGFQKEDSLVKKEPQTSEPKLTSSNKMKMIPTKERLNTDKLVMKYIRKGLFYYQNKNFEQGIEEFEMVIKLKPGDAKAFYHIGMGKYRLNDYYGALEAFSASSGLNPQDTVSLIYAGLSKFYLEDYYGAIRYYDKAIDQNPDYEYAYFNRGIANGKVENYERAITDFNRAIELKSNYFEAYNNRGNAYYYLKQKEHACADWEKAKELGAKGIDEILEKLCK